MHVLKWRILCVFVFHQCTCVAMQLLAAADLTQQRNAASHLQMKRWPHLNASVHAKGSSRREAMGSISRQKYTPLLQRGNNQIC